MHFLPSDGESEAIRIKIWFLKSALMREIVHWRIKRLLKFKLKNSEYQAYVPVFHVRYEFDTAANITACDRQNKKLRLYI